MKILFVQNIGNLIGGIVNVNNKLANEFSNDGNEVYIYSVRKGGECKFEKAGITYKTINEKKTWGCPLYSEILLNFKRLHLLEGFKLLAKRISYNVTINIDYLKLKKEIIKIQPDYIIVSYYEILKAIPKKYLGRTINHYHTNFGQVKLHRTQLKLFKKYKDKIKKFIWLTQSSCNEAKKYELNNSLYIYNPLIPLKAQKINKEKRLIFLARYSPEKRVELAITIFNNVVKREKLDDWFLDLYLVGDLEKSVEELISSSKNVCYKGKIDNPYSILAKYSGMLMTSEFEGFPLTVLEAAQCEVPTIAFDFGESSKEVIINERTGIIIKQNDVKEYENKLINFIKNEQYREKMAKNCYNFTENFSIERIKKDWYNLLEEE